MMETQTGVYAHPDEMKQDVFAMEEVGWNVKQVAVTSTPGHQYESAGGFGRTADSFCGVVVFERETP